MAFKYGATAPKHNLQTMRSAVALALAFNELPPPPDNSPDWLAAVRKQAPSIPGYDSNYPLWMFGNDTLGCHDNKTEVLTINGWQKWPDYNGSLLGTMNQVTGMLEFQYPTNLVRRDYDGPMYFSDHKSQDFALTPEHRMFYRNYKIPHPYIKGGAGYGQYQFGAIDNVSKFSRFAIPATTTGFIGTELKTIKIGTRIWDGDDFLALIALIASDGYTGGTENTWNRISFCCFREDRRDMVAALAYKLGIQEAPERKGVWRLSSDPAFAEWLRINMYNGNVYKSPYKHVPELVKVASSRQINIFLNFFGDQHIYKDGYRQFYSSSQKMIDDLQELLLRIGKRGGISDRPQRDSGINSEGKKFKAIEGHRDITLHEWKSNDLIGFQKLTKKQQIYEDYYKGEIFCATVPNSTLITRRNGSILISGNCCVIADIGHQSMLWSANTGTMVITPETQIINWYEAIGGYDPTQIQPDGSNPTDNGCNELDACNYLIKQGILAAAASIDPANIVHQKWAINLYGSIKFGIQVPDFAQDLYNQGKVWDVPVSYPATPLNFEGGHDVCGVCYVKDGSSYLMGLITWGRLQYATPAFMAAVVGEVHVPMSNVWAPLTNVLAPSGYDHDVLIAALNQAIKI